MWVLFVLLIWGFLGIAALVVDWGYVTLSRIQMQNAAEMAAIEGLRLRDANPDQTQSDFDRREAASKLVSWTFDDDFLETSSDALQFGAGPDITLSGGSEALNANQGLSLDAVPVYKPTLEHNLGVDEEGAPVGNEAHGDMVSGTFDPAEKASETPQYSRTDFSPADPSSSPEANAFLVRLRRTNDPEGKDNLDNESSSGPTLPLLAGLGSMIQGDPEGIRFTGFTVRATAIADARPVRQVGPPSEFPTVLGTTPYTYERSSWNSLTDGLHSGTVDASGALTVNSTVIGQYSEPLFRIGQEPVAQVPPSVFFYIDDGYAPIVDDILGTTRVVGFARMSLSGTIPGPVEITKVSQQVASENATTQAGADFSSLTSEELTKLFEVNRALQAEGALLAPALVR